MTRKTRLFILLFLPLFFYECSGMYAQNVQKRDSLYKAVAVSSGIEKAKALNLLTEMMLRNTPDSALQLASLSIAILQKIKNNNEAKKELARALTFRSILYSDKADYEMALQGLLEALKLNEETGEKKQIANSLNSIGRVYYGLQNPDMAMKYWNDALILRKELGNKKDIAISLGNIGVIYIDKPGEIDSAMYYYTESLKLYKELNDNRGKAMSYNNMAIYYQRKKNYSKALEYYFFCLPITEQLNDLVGQANTLNNIGQAYSIMGDYKNAMRYLEKGASISKEIGAKQLMATSYRSLVETHIHLNEPDKAIAILEELLTINDSMYNSENSKNIAEMQTKYESEKKDKELIKKDIEITKQQADAKQKAIQRNASIAGFALVLLFTFFIYRNYKQKQKAHLEILKQKEIIQKKNKEIVDSINYAQLIQQAVLPSSEELTFHLKDGFVLFQPKDIVSGDFYWVNAIDNYTFFTAVDCTGHGVPGGFMSMLGSSLLTEVINEKKILEPADVLDMMRIKLIASLKQKGNSGENKDGMDMTLCRLNAERTELVYASANNPLWLIRDEKIIEFPADKQPVGISTDHAKHFSQHKIDLQKGDSIYIFTDGYADQFGGPKGKKFKYKALQQVLLNNIHLSMNAQKDNLKKCIDDWKGDLEQVDDILIIGVRI